MAPRRSTRGKGGGSRSNASLKMDENEMDDIDLIEQPKQHVSLDLQSSDDDSDNQSSDSEMENDDNEQGEEEEEEEDDNDSDEDDDSDNDSDDVEPETAWGRSSSQYYAGDTADLEIGQDFEEAKEEEAIAAKLQKKKRMAEDESDYLIMDTHDVSAFDDDEEGGDEEEGEGSGAKSLRDVSKLDDAAQLKVIMAESPELRGLLEQMKKYLDELSLLGLALDEAHMGQADSVTEEGLAYLELRNHLLLSFVMNVNFYLLLKAEKKPVRDHPVVTKLLKLQKAINKLAPLEEKAGQAVGYLVQKAAEEVYDEEEEGDSDDEGESGEEDELEVVQEEEDEEEEEEEEEEEDISTIKMKKAEEKRQKKELKFQKKSTALIGTDKSKKRNSAHLGNDAGDMEVSGVAPKLQAMMNTMIQKQKSKKVKTLGGDEDVPISEVKAKKVSLVGSNEMSPEDQFDDLDGGDGDLDDDDLEGLGEDFFKPLKADKSSLVTGNQFYEEVKAVAAAKQKKRKDKYGVVREVSGSHIKELGDDAKRATPYQIIKNRGLVAHKSKINRNPRVKKRKQFREATIRRKGQVRDIRDSAEGANYQGEATGIRTGVTRSRAITN